MDKRIALPLTVIACSGIALFAATQVHAEDITGRNGQAIVQKIAQKFGLKETDVQAVFDQNRQDRQKEHETAYEAKLSGYVKEGKITEAQKQLILAKHKELQTAHQQNMQNMQGKTPEEKKAAMEKWQKTMETERAELEAWAKANGIDPTYLMFGEGPRGQRNGLGAGK